jgi:hypothetical protein
MEQLALTLSMVSELASEGLYEDLHGCWGDRGEGLYSSVNCSRTPATTRVRGWAVVLFACEYSRNSNNPYPLETVPG